MIGLKIIFTGAVVWQLSMVLLIRSISDAFFKILPVALSVPLHVSKLRLIVSISGTIASSMQCPSPSEDLVSMLCLIGAIGVTPIVEEKDPWGV